MFELKGNYTSAKIFQDEYKVEGECIKQIQTLIDSNAYEGCEIRIMPDCHAGASCPIGTTIILKDKVIPETVSVDIGCGILIVKLGKIDIDYKKLDKVIKKYVPAGMNVNKDPSWTKTQKKKIDSLYCIDNISNYDRISKSLGSVGGGNHFISIEKDEEENKYLLVHTGSRNLGVQVAEYYQNLADTTLNDRTKEYEKEKNDFIAKCKEMDDTYLIPEGLKKINEKYKEKVIPRDLAYLEGENFDKYIHDMKICQEFAVWNREKILKTIVKKCFKDLKWKDLEKFETIHNYIDMSDPNCLILRKGAVAAKLGEKLIVPLNMRDGSLICEGLGNEEYNWSCPHGAGRLMSRNRARDILSMDTFKKSMEGIYTTCVCKETIDESAMAYKPLTDILPHIEPTVRVINQIKTLYNFKASE